MTTRGGYRRPTNPAPVSGPGRLSRRTDGGPGQPLRAPTGGDYGDRKALMDQQRAAPLASSPPSPGPGAASGGGGAGVLGAGPGLAAPPTNPLAHMSPGGGNQAPVIVQRDPNAMLRALYAVYPHPDIARYLRS